MGKQRSYNHFSGSLDENLESFKELVKDLSANQASLIFPNKGARFASIVIGEIFKNAKEKVRILANDMNGEINNNDEYIEGLKEAIKKNIKIDVVLHNIEYLTNPSKGLKLLLDHKGQNVNFYHVNVIEDSKLNNLFFATGDNKMFRLEFDNNTHTASCSFDDPKRTEDLNSIFNNLLKKSNPVP